jgi:hypothetical protein
MVQQSKTRIRFALLSALVVLTVARSATGQPLFGIEASNDGHVYKTASDRRGYPALVTAPWLRTIPEEAAFVRPRVYAGDETTSITVTAVFRRPTT